MRKKLMRATIAVGIVALAITIAALLVVRLRAPSSHPPLPSEPLLAALAAAKQPPATIAAVRHAAQLGEPCQYAELATRAALDADLHALALSTLDAAPQPCPGFATRNGQRAEALARSSAGSEAERLAHTALQANAKDAYAELALALVSYDRNEMAHCSEHAQNSLQLGRGVQAERLLARADLARGQYKEAEEHFRALLRENPQDAEAAFSGAVCNDKLGRYHAAREGFLQTLSINPQHAEARRYLVVLTYKSGAKDEARHHLMKLRAILAKDSPVLAELEQLVAEEPNQPARAPAPQLAQP